MPQPPEPVAKVESAPMVDMSEWELPSSEPDPISKTAPGGASAAQRPAAETPPASPKHSSRSLRLAQHLGISQHEIDTFSRDDLLHEIRAAQAEQEQIAMEGRRGRGLDAQERPAPKKVEPVEPPLWSDEESEYEEDDPENLGKKRKVKLTEDQLAPPVVKTLKQMRKRIAELEGKSEAKDQAAAKMSREQEIDAAFNSLPDEYKEVFGTGTIRDLSAANDPAAEVRQAVWAHLTAHPPKENLSPKEAVAQRSKSLYGRFLEARPAPAAETNLYEQPAQGARPAPAPRSAPPQNPTTGRFERPTVEDWEEAPIARPTSRQTAPLPKGPERARAAVREKLRAQNAASGRNGDGNGEEWEELPD